MIDAAKRILTGVGVGFAMSFSAVAAFVILVSFLNIVSPPLVSDQNVLQFVAFFCIVLVVGIPACWHFFQQQLNSIPDYALSLMKEDTATKSMVQNLRIRSRLFKLASAVALAIMLGIAVLGFTAALNPPYYQPAAPVTVEPQPSESQENAWSRGIGAMVLLIILLRMFTIVYRSNMRLASFYDARADYLQFGGDPRKLSHGELLKLVTADEHDMAWTHVLGRAWRRQGGASVGSEDVTPGGDKRAKDA